MTINLVFVVVTAALLTVYVDANQTHDVYADINPDSTRALTLHIHLNDLASRLRRQSSNAVDEEDSEATGMMMGRTIRGAFEKDTFGDDDRRLYQRQVPCGNTECYNGLCLRSDDDTSATKCKCYEGYQGEKCEQFKMECAKNRWKCRDGSCENHQGTHICRCADGGFGVDCHRSHINPCSSSSPINSVHGLRSFGSDTPNIFVHCLSNETFIARKCPRSLYFDQEAETCVVNRPEAKTGQCRSYPCTNGGRCVDMGNTYACICPSGFSGRDCTEKTDYCTGKPCGKGKCRSWNGGYTCECTEKVFDQCCCNGVVNKCNRHGMDFYAHNATAFVHCGPAGEAYLKSCPDELVWNQFLKTCTRPETYAHYQNQDGATFHNYGERSLPTAEHPQTEQPLTTSTEQASTTRSTTEAQLAIVTEEAKHNVNWNIQGMQASQAPTSSEPNDREERNMAKVGGDEHSMVSQPETSRSSGFDESYPSSLPNQITSVPQVSFRQEQAFGAYPAKTADMHDLKSQYNDQTRDPEHKDGGPSTSNHKMQKMGVDGLYVVEQHQKPPSNAELHFNSHAADNLEKNQPVQLMGVGQDITSKTQLTTLPANPAEAHFQYVKVPVSSQYQAGSGQIDAQFPSQYQADNRHMNTQLPSQYQADNSQMNTQLPSQYQADNRQMNAQLPSQYQVDNRQMNAQLSSQYQADSGQVNAPMPSQYQSDSQQMNAQLPSQYQTDNRQINAQLPSIYQVDSGQMNTQLPSQYQADSGQINAQLSNQYQADNQQMNSPLPSQYQADNRPMNTQLPSRYQADSGQVNAQLPSRYQSDSGQMNVQFPSQYQTDNRQRNAQFPSRYQADNRQINAQLPSRYQADNRQMNAQLLNQYQSDSGQVKAPIPSQYQTDNRQMNVPMANRYQADDDQKNPQLSSQCQSDSKHVNAPKASQYQADKSHIHAQLPCQYQSDSGQVNAPMANYYQVNAREVNAPMPKQSQVNDVHMNVVEGSILNQHLTPAARTNLGVFETQQVEGMATRKNTSPHKFNQDQDIKTMGAGYNSKEPHMIMDEIRRNNQHQVHLPAESTVIQETRKHLQALTEMLPPSHILPSYVPHASYVASDVNQQQGLEMPSFTPTSIEYRMQGTSEKPSSIVLPSIKVLQPQVQQSNSVPSTFYRISEPLSNLQNYNPSMPSAHASSLQSLSSQHSRLTSGDPTLSSNPVDKPELVSRHYGGDVSFSDLRNDDDTLFDESSRDASNSVSFGPAGDVIDEHDFTGLDHEPSRHIQTLRNPIDSQLVWDIQRGPENDDEQDASRIGGDQISFKDHNNIHWSPLPSSSSAHHRQCDPILDANCDSTHQERFDVSPSSHPMTDDRPRKVPMTIEDDVPRPLLHHTRAVYSDRSRCQGGGYRNRYGQCMGGDDIPAHLSRSDHPVHTNRITTSRKAARIGPRGTVDKQYIQVCPQGSIIGCHSLSEDVVEAENNNLNRLHHYDSRTIRSPDDFQEADQSSALLENVSMADPLIVVDSQDAIEHTPKVKSVFRRYEDEDNQLPKEPLFAFKSVNSDKTSLDLDPTASTVVPVKLLHYD